MKSVYKFYEATQTMGLGKTRLVFGLSLFVLDIKLILISLKERWIEFISWSYTGPFYALLIFPFAVLSTALLILASPLIAIKKSIEMLRWYEGQVKDGKEYLESTYKIRSKL